MGCTSSKLDDLPALILCRERCGFLDDAIRLRYALAEAHVAYIRSLKEIGHSLHNFIEHDLRRIRDSGVELEPPKQKGDLIEEGPSSPKKSAVSLHSDSNSGSHLQFHSDSEDEEDSDTHSLHHSDHSSPLHSHEGGQIEYPSPVYPKFMGQEPGMYPGGFMHVNFMMNKATPSVVYEQRPLNPQTVHMEIGESSSSAYYPYSYNSNNPNPGSSSYPNFGYSNSNYSNFNNYPSYGSSAPPPPLTAEAKPPPPPPPPSSASTWDFLNPFESYDKYYPPYTPSTDSREVREEEGIPDVEDEDFHHEVAKEVDGNEKFLESGSHSKSSVDDEDGKVSISEVVEASLFQTRPSEAMENEEGVEYEVHVVEKKVVNDEKSEEHGNGARSGPMNASEVAREIEVQFVRASESGNEIATMLEVGKFPYQRKHASKMLHVVTPSLSIVSASKMPAGSSSAEGTSPAVLDFHEDLVKGSRNLSSTLHKLYLWEKKLYNEVKVEEKMRVDHERKFRKLKRLDEKGAEAHKVETTRSVVRSLSTKIRIAIQVVDKMSVTINKIRDEELWPQLNELIQGLNRMWKTMLDCYHNQCETIREAKDLGPMGSGKKLSDNHLEATLQLEHELLNWTFSFSSWVGAQKGFVTALNNWLFKCLLYEPESTEDGIIPFSPGRLGAPPVFIICHQWAQALERISENEVIDSLRAFAMSVLQLLEQDKIEMRERMTANRDLEKTVRNLDREDLRIQKEIQALDKKIVLASGDGNGLSLTGHVVYQSDTSSGSLQGNLQRIFEAMERFTAESLKAYEELLQRCEEETAAREHGRGS